MPFCHSCGSSLEAADRFCPQCGTGIRGTGTSESSAVPPTEKAIPEGEMKYGGVGIRFVAQIFDGIIIFIFYFVVGYITASIFGGLKEGGFDLHGGPAILVIMLTLAFGIAYFTVFEVLWRGQSLGKKLIGIRVVREDGGPIDLTAALVRNILRIVDGFACYLVAAILVWNSPLRQRLGDRIAHTVVVKMTRA